MDMQDAKALQATFDLRYKADMRAIKRWQEAHPGNEFVWPDHADLVVWLMEQHDEAQKARKVFARVLTNFEQFPDSEGLEVISSHPDDEEGEEGVGACDFTLGQLRRVCNP